MCGGGKYTKEDAKTVMIQILNVVAFCHLQGVVHRDLKPEVVQSSLIQLIHLIFHRYLFEVYLKRFGTEFSLYL